MLKGAVVSIHTANAATEPLRSVDEVHAVPGKGLEGDRYFKQAGTFSKPLPDREVTLIEIEAIEALEHEQGIRLEPGEGRRNIVTRGVPLSDLIGREFQVGEVLLRGLGPCEPCSHLEKLTQRGVIRGLAHRGGLRAQILTSGMIRVGDEVQAREASRPDAGRSKNGK